MRFRDPSNQSYAPAGAIVSTISDMMKYLRANIRCANNALGHAMKTSHELGLGWDSSPGDGIIWKNGGTYGFSTIITFDTSHAVGTVVLTNMNNILSDYVGALAIEQTNQYPASNIYKTFTQSLFNESTVPVSPTLMSQASGTYTDSDGQGSRRMGSKLTKRQLGDVGVFHFGKKSSELSIDVQTRNFLSCES